MKKIITLMFAVVLTFGGISVLTGKTIAGFKQRQYMLGPDMQFSPDGSKLAFIAKDGKKYYGPAYLYIGSSFKGNFSKIFPDPVDQYTWKNNNEIIYSVKEKDSVTVKSGNIKTRSSRVIFTKKLQMSGSGYARSYEKFEVKCISPDGNLMIVEKEKGACAIVQVSGQKETPLPGFTVPYSSNPQSTLKFSGNSKRLLLFDGKNRIYSVYDVSNSGLRLLKKIDTIKGITPGSDYLLNDRGDQIIFTQEKCKGGCYHIVYIYDLTSKKIYENITIRSGQILRVAFDRDFKNAVINDMHRRLMTFTLRKNGKEIK
ncbi:MAG TPA: hypothetical protein PK358_08480 [Spirochaetota bacterium]|nr:hypothetical protein [Spirochaetota bacterium]HPJ34855.1 hypothetical protein [Spirochaetota bacterium]